MKARLLFGVLVGTAILSGVPCFAADEDDEKNVTSLEKAKTQGPMGFSALVQTTIPDLSAAQRSVTNDDDWGVALEWKGEVPPVRIQGLGELPAPEPVGPTMWVKHDGKYYEVMGAIAQTRPLKAGKEVRLALHPGKYRIWFTARNSQGGSLGSQLVEVELTPGLNDVISPSFR